MLIGYLILTFLFAIQSTRAKMLPALKLNEDIGDNYCAAFRGEGRLAGYSKLKQKLKSPLFFQRGSRAPVARAPDAALPGVQMHAMTSPPPTVDPIHKLQIVLDDFLYGPPKAESASKYLLCLDCWLLGGVDMAIAHQVSKLALTAEEQEKLEKKHFPSGSIMHAQLFRNKSAVHLPEPALLHRDHCRLRETSDHMQTAADAFAIILWGGEDDVRALPREYVLRSARAIAMMMISREKLAAMWDVVLAQQRASTITIETLEQYRPLFKYLNGKQIARLNLKDERILNYIGTHPDLNRHQVGVVASKYIAINKDWSKPKYLNIMNNLICGVPITYMRKLPENTYLQLAHQVFYHIKACDPLQKRFYLRMMTKTQALGKAYSWSARDVSRLGLLMAEVPGFELAAIPPGSMSGLNAQVMNMIEGHKLVHITEMQYRYIRQKPLNILAWKLKLYHKNVLASCGPRVIPGYFLTMLVVLLRVCGQ